MEYTHHYISPLGGITLSGDGDALTGLWFDGQKYFPEGLPAGDHACTQAADRVFAQAAEWLDVFFSGREPDFTPPLHPEGSDFRKAVWRILLSIPRGQTLTYGEIAARIAGERGLPRISAQAVGGAVGHNPVSIIIPCHRVIGSDGSLTGYAGGLERKRKLLELEGVLLS
ncbi:MAG: methylated-DNA--[Lachnospiraceae bacterium]|nr:methylated-DNA--[protein]-cysteine S-methyltransferase [Lachnospiraceae bacterium]